MFLVRILVIYMRRMSCGVVVLGVITSRDKICINLTSKLGGRHVNYRLGLDKWMIIMIWMMNSAVNWDICWYLSWG